MIDRLRAWLRARSPRERMLIGVAGAAFAALFLLGGFQAAQAYRDEASADLDRARKISADVAKIAKLSPTSSAVGADGSLQGRALAQAKAQGLEVAQVQPLGGDGLRVTFEPGDDQAVFDWMQALIKSGAFVQRTSIIRGETGDTVRAEFDLAPAPS